MSLAPIASRVPGEHPRNRGGVFRSRPAGGETTVSHRAQRLPQRLVGRGIAAELQHPGVDLGAAFVAAFANYPVTAPGFGVIDPTLSGPLAFLWIGIIRTCDGAGRRARLSPGACLPHSARMIARG